MLDYAEASRAEAQQLADAIAQLDAVLARASLTGTSTDVVTALRGRAATTLIDLRAGLEDLNSVTEADIFGTDPTLAGRRHALIRIVEKSKVTFELDILPNLRRLARSTIEQNRESPPDHVNAQELPEPVADEPAGGWTVQRVLDSAERLIGESDRVAGLVPKVISVAHALSLLASLVPA